VRTKGVALRKREERGSAVGHYEGGGDFGDFGPTFVGGGQEDVEERVEVVAHVIVGFFTDLDVTRGDGEL
jgi:hypothetical protein